ncbi:MAG: hypothetical protein J5740_05545 [Bacteroidales bacterium]|nr:hypothetical protein [Bacteroidales bacterium]
MKRIALMLMMAVLMVSCAKDGLVLSKGKATLYIVESKSGEKELKPKTGKLSINKVADFCYNIDVQYKFNDEHGKEQSVSFRLNEIPFGVEEGKYVINAYGIQGSGAVNSEEFDFSNISVSGVVGSAAETHISFEGETHGESFAVQIEKVSESAKDVPSYKEEYAEVDYMNYSSATFRNGSGMKCTLLLTYKDGSPESIEINPEESYTLKTRADGDLWYILKDIEVDFSNGNHIAGSPENILAHFPGQDAPINMISNDQDWFLFVYFPGYIGTWTYPKYVFYIPKP